MHVTRTGILFEVLFLSDLTFKHVCSIAFHKPSLNPKQNQEKFNRSGEASDSNSPTTNNQEQAASWARKQDVESPPAHMCGSHSDPQDLTVSILFICCRGSWTKLLSKPMPRYSSRGMTAQGPTQKAPWMSPHRRDSSTLHSPSTL